mgnify:CR=1 FL=1
MKKLLALLLAALMLIGGAQLYAQALGRAQVGIVERLFQIHFRETAIPFQLDFFVTSTHGK